jgi:hypothetical protein
MLRPLQENSEPLLRQYFGIPYSGLKPSKRVALFGRDRHIGMTAAEHDDGITGRAAVGTRAQSPPYAERIHDRHPRADIEQSLDKALRRVSLARAGGADDRAPDATSPAPSQG